jgi:hypothetical protein
MLETLESQIQSVLYCTEQGVKLDWTVEEAQEEKV